MKKRITFTISEELIAELREISEKTMIPQSKLVEKTLQDIVDEYKKQVS